MLLENGKVEGIDGVVCESVVEAKLLLSGSECVCGRMEKWSCA